MIILDREGLSRALSGYTGNPFLDAMIDMQGLFNTISAYYKHKPFIDRYSDTKLSDLKDKIKAYLPEAVDKDGNINFAKVEELAVQGNKVAEAILGIKTQREVFANATVGDKLETLLNPEKAQQLTPILSGELLTTQVKVMNNLKKVEELIKNAGFSKEMEAILLLNKEKIANNPELLSAFLQYFTLQPKEEKQTNKQETNQSSTQQQTSAQQQQTTNGIYFQAPQIKDMRTVAKENLKVPKLNYNDPYAVAQNILSDPQFQEFVEKQKKKKKSKVSEKLKQNPTEADILKYLKSLPQYPPVIFYPPGYPYNMQGSPIWHNNILTQISNPRPLKKE
jgi:hypothetical protein